MAISPAQVEHRRLLAWWLTGSAVLLVILVAFAGYFVFATVSSFVHTGLGCLPNDFPRYPRVVIVEIDQRYDSLQRGDTMDCRMRLASTDHYDSVNTFYRARLNSGDWWYSSYFEPPDGSQIDFSRRSRALTRGTMTIHKQLGGTPFEVDLVS